ncbi:MAG: pre-peptidase C-terminal domain-containing protein [Cyanobacteria bacterium J06600_6]
MSKTNKIEIHFPGWQFWIFSLIISSIVLAIQPLVTQAQAETDRSATTKIANSGQNQDLEPKILSEINRVRTAPQSYAQWLEVQRQYYDGIWLRLPGEKPVRTNKGRKALEEAIAFLKEQQPLPPLKSSTQTAAAATSELKNFANSNNIQYFSYGRKTATGIVMDLVVDELFPDRRRRQSLLSSEASETGVVCKPDPRYAKVCAIAYSDSPVLDRPSTEPTADIAIAEPNNSTPENALPPTEMSELPKPVPEVENSASKPQTEAESTADPIAEAEQSQPKPDSAAVATLPVPPQPQVPAGNSAREDDQPNKEETAELEAELQITQAETEIEQEQQELDASEPNLENSEPEAVEEAKNIDQEELEPEDEVAEELEPEDESPVVAETATEVAINTETAGFSEKVEKGRLEAGDRIIADDGSLYDFYPLQGKAGESFTIYLESDDFDAFVALVDSGGQTIGENDDISQSDSNSQIEVTLPADGVYNVIVNTYDENGTGEYTLKVSQ